MNITVKYTCHPCGLVKVAVDVPERGEEDVLTWMKQTSQLIANDHLRRSPACPSRQCDLLIPHDAHNKNARVGEPRKH